MRTDHNCSTCGRPNQRMNHNYCANCFATYMRLWRKTHFMSREAIRKDVARSIANVYKRRGKLVRKPCEACGSVDSQMHHDDYSRPLDVRWFCRPCHLGLHRAERKAA